MSRASNQLPEVVQKEKEKYQYPTDEEGRRIITKMTPKAWDILLLHLSDPQLTQTQIAEKLDSNQVYISRVMNSPCFLKEMTGIRRQRIHDRLNRAVESGVDRMERILDDEESADAVAVAAFKAVTSAAGFCSMGGGGNSGNQVNVNVNAESLGVTPEMIAEANARRKAKIFDGEYREVKDE